MRSKRFLSLFTTAMLLIGSAPSVFAAEKIQVSNTSVAAEQQANISKDKAKTIAKSKLKDYLNYELDEKLFQFNADFSPYYNYSTKDYVWYINWTRELKDKSVNISVTINAGNGDVISIRKNEYIYNQSQPAVAQITSDKAKQSAEAFIKKYFPGKLDQVKLVENTNYYNQANYNFNYVRVLKDGSNSVVCDDNYINIDVDGISGNVTGFEKRWDDSFKLPDLSSIISIDEAKSLYQDKVNINLSYISYLDKYGYNKQTQSTKLVYNLGLLGSMVIDASTGKVFDRNYDDNTVVETKNLTDAEKNSWLKKIVQNQTSGTELTSEEAKQAITKILKDMLKADYEVQDLRYSENQNSGTSSQKSWGGSFYKKDGANKNITGEISIDAISKEIVYFYFYNTTDDANFTAAVAWKDAYNKALDAVAKYYPSKAKNINTEQTHISYKNLPKGYEERQYYFNFQRTENGVPYADNNISVTIDAKTGLVTGISSYWNTALTFSQVNGIKTLNEAKSIILDKYKPELAYISVSKVTATGETQSENKLVYRLSGTSNYNFPPYMNASTGQLLNYDGQEIYEVDNKFLETIKGNTKENELKVLAYQQIIDTKTFKLDKAITKLDFYKMLVNAKGYVPYYLQSAADLKFSNVAKSDANYGYLQLAVYYGILDNEDGEFKADETMTREEMAKSLVKFLSYDKLAQVKDIFVLSVSDSKDVSADNIGYVAIAKALGILDSQNNKIRPKDKTTMLEAALAVYNILGEIRQ